MTEPPPAVWRRGPPYLLVPLLALAVLVAGMRLDRHDFAMPLGYNGGDVMLILPMVQAAHEAGSHWTHPRLAAPDTQDLRDFPVVDLLHFAGLRLLCAATGDVMTAFNLYFVLTYPLTALTTLYALRRLGLSVPAAACGAVLYAFTPYHQLRNLGHYFLSAYYVVPLTTMVALEIAGGRLPLFAGRAGGTSPRSDGPPRAAGPGVTAAPPGADAPGSPRTVTTLAIAALTSVAGAYYAFFGCAALAFAGVYGACALRSWRPAAAAAVVTGVVVLGGVLAHLPTIRYQADAGRNPAPTFRLADEAETFGLKLTHLVLPVDGHRLDAFAAVKARYDTPHRPVQTENRTATLGAVGTAGLAILLAGLLLPGSGRLRAAAAVTGFLLLLGTVGGLGAVFNHLVSAQVRAYCRVSILVAFLALLAACGAVDWLLAARPRAARWVAWPAFALLGGAGVLDQTHREWFTPAIVPGRDELAKEYRADAAFYAQADAADAAMAFCLPYIAYPETTQVGALAGYDHARGVVHTASARWSFGAMKGRVADEWQRETSALPVPALLDRLAARGFTHLYVNAKGYAPPDAARLVSAVRTTRGVAELAPHAQGGRHLFDLRAFADRRRADLGPAFDALASADRGAVRVEWLAGFAGFEPPGEASRVHLAQATADLVLVNPGEARTVRVGFRAWTLAGESVLSIDGGAVWTAAGPVTADPAVRAATITVPPGRHKVVFRCPPPAGWTPADERRAVAVVADLTLAAAE